jgi:lysozyme family protein
VGGSKCIQYGHHEGGHVNNPADPGGGTKFGISKRSYPQLDIRNLTLADARAIYERNYWNKAGCPDLPPRLALAVFDAAVNNGVKHTVSFLQIAVKAQEDGVYGPETKTEAKNATIKDPDDLTLAQEVHAQRILFMVRNPKWSEFGRGWARRLAAIPPQGAHHWPA